MRGALSSLLQSKLQERFSEEPLYKAYTFYSSGEPVPRELIEELLASPKASNHQERKSSLENFLSVVLLCLPQIERSKELLVAFAKELLVYTIFDEARLVQVEKHLMQALLSLPAQDLFSLEAPFKELKSYAKESQMLSFEQIAKYALCLLLLARIKREPKYLKASFELLLFFKEIIDFEKELLPVLWSNEKEYESGDLFSILFVCFEELSLADQDSDYSKCLEFCRAKLEEKCSSCLLAILAQDFLQTKEPIFLESREVSHLFSKALRGIKTDHMKALLTPFGLKTGLGALQRGSVCVKAFGPQSAPLTTGEFFGIYEPYHKKRIALLRETSFKGWFQTAKRDRWLYFSIEGKGSTLHIKSQLQKSEHSSGLFFSFYLNADEVELKGRSIKKGDLHSYQGQANELCILSNEDKLLFSSEEEMGVKVMALAGMGCFWDADFLISYELKANGTPLLLTISG